VALRERLNEALRADAAAGAAPGSSLLLPRPSGARPWIVTVTRLGTNGPLGNGDQPVAAVFIADPEPVPTLPARSLQSLFGLTPSEARVAQLLAEGKGLKHVATRLGLALSTVKTHVQRALAKTGTSRQAELTKIIVHVGALLAPSQVAA
jgi:DNA-binding CsgD family transcriptional regulator